MRGILFGALVASSLALAQDNTQLLLPLTETGAVPQTTARLHSSAVSGASEGGGLTLSNLVEVTAADRASLKVTFDVGGSEGVSPAVRLKLQILKQETAGVDASVGARYKVKGLDPKGAEVEAFVAVSRRFGRVFVAANLVTGGGIDTGDRDVEAHLGGGYMISDNFAVGANARLIREWNPADDQPGAEAPQGNAFDLVAGPTATFSYGVLQLSAIAGVHVIKDTDATAPYLGAGAGVAF